MTEPRHVDGSVLAAEDYLLLAAVLLLPWAFGGVEIWAHRSAALLLVGAGSIALVKQGGLGAWGVDRQSVRWLAPAVLLAAWAALQILPLPAPLIRLLSPEAHRLYTKVLPAYGGTGGATTDVIGALEAQSLALVPEAEGHAYPQGGPERFDMEAPECLSDRYRTLSLEPSATADRLGWYVALLVGFLVLRRRVADPRRSRVYTDALFVLFAALAAFGFLQAETWNGKLYWWRTLRVDAHPFGPYVDPTHFAGAMELAVPALVGHAWSRLRRSGRSGLYEARFVLTVVAAVVCFVAGVAAASKLASLLLALGVGALVVANAARGRRRWISVAVTVGLVAAAAYGMLRSPLGARVESYLGRLDLSMPFESRQVIWVSSMDMIRDYPITGAGFGTFREVFPRYMPAGSYGRWAQAHNDYLEVLLDGGAVGFALVVWLAAAYGRRVARRFSSLDPAERLRAGGLLAGVLSLGVHAFFEFNHQMPANALLFVTFCALLLPAAAGSARSRARS
jgi:O-antigen ligase